MRVKGLKWTQLKTTWSVKGKKKTVEELADRLKFIIEVEEEKKLDVPLEPEVELPQLKDSTVLGTKTREAKEFEEQCQQQEENVIVGRRK